MPYPRGDQYNEAVQYPAIAFSDEDLKSGTIEKNKWGLPNPYSGGFTVTYKLDTRQKKWAVRCFYRDIQELQRRYQAISNFIAQKQSPYFVEAKYLHNGIKVNGIPYPIIKMLWIEGESLNNYLDKISFQKQEVENILNGLVRLTNDLEQHGIAHGDLQHGNIIVENKQLRLIDYDDMYLPELVGLQTNGIGHSNYQHPQRSSTQYNKNIDRFSTIIIYTGLKAMSINPGLWQKYDTGENILFKNQDFVKPRESHLINELLAMPGCKQIAKNLIACCEADFDKIPSLQEFISKELVLSRSGISNTSTYTRSPYVVLDGENKKSIAKYIGQRVEVITQINQLHTKITKSGIPYALLNSTYPQNQSIVFVIWREGLEDLLQKGIKLGNLRDKYVSITGVIQAYYDNMPQIVIEKASQVKVLSGEEARKRLMEEERRRRWVDMILKASQETITERKTTPIWMGDWTLVNTTKTVQRPAKTIPVPTPPPIYSPQQPSKATSSKKENSWVGKMMIIIIIIFTISGAILFASIPKKAEIKVDMAIVGSIVGAGVSFVLLGLISSIFGKKP
jgi:serine/threonine protein kinase